MGKGTRPLTHVAFIMDGNRRWARAHPGRGLYDSASADAVFEAIAACKQQGVLHVSLYAFSLENAAVRDGSLKEHLFNTLIRVCHEKQEAFNAEQVRVRFVGVRELYPRDVREAVETLEQATAQNTGLYLSILFFYGGKQEIVSATRLIVDQVLHGSLQPEDIDFPLFESYLWTKGIPSPELIIRTGGARRLSNFLLYQAAYSELMFLDCLWPELTRQMVDECIKEFYAIESNEGR